MPDAVVVGAGHNGLVAANYLVDAGWSVTVLEEQAEPGGAVRSAELTLPGFVHDAFSAFYPLAVASPALRALDLEQHGLRWLRSPLVLAHPLPDGRCASISADVEATARGLDGFHPGDGAAWHALMGEWDRIADPLLGTLLGPFPPLRHGARLARRLGFHEGLRLARQLLLPVRRLVEERFAGQGAALLLGGNALHADVAPESAGSGLYGWLLSCLGQRVGYPVPAGGAAALTRALLDRLAARGGQVICGTAVTKIELRSGRAVGVATADGSFVDARRAVLADVSAPSLYLDLVDGEHLPSGLRAAMSRFEWDTSTVKVDWALARPVPWQAPEARLSGTVHVADDFDNFTEHSAQLAMGRLPSRPFLIFGQQSMTDPSRSPAGTETAWAYCRVPRRVRADAAGTIDIGGSAAPARSTKRGPEEVWLPAMVERIEARIERLAPGFGDAVVGRHVFGPAKLQAADANLHLGAITGGTAQLHQQVVFRPVPGARGPATPIPNLFLASASAHPGGGVHGACGANAARAALRRSRTGRAVRSPPRRRSE